LPSNASDRYKTKNQIGMAVLEDEDELSVLVCSPLIFIIIKLTLILFVLKQQEFEWLLNEEVDVIMNQLRSIILVNQLKRLFY